MALKTSAEMWARLDALYAMKSETSVHLLLQRFFEYQMDPSGDVGQHVANVEELCRQLDEAGSKQDEVTLVTKVLCSLPSSYRHVQAAWDSVPKNEQTMANLLPRLLKEQMLSKRSVELAEVEGGEPAALYHNSGQYKKDRSNWHNGQKKMGQSRNREFRGKCFRCGEFGHRKIDCQADEQMGGSNMACFPFRPVV